MTFSVVLLKGGVVVQTLGTLPPFVSADNVGTFDASNPPRLTAITKTVTIEGLLYGNDSSAKANYDALVAQFENAGSYPDGLQVKEGSTVVLDLTGHDYFKIERVALPKSDRQWRNELAFTIQVSAVRRFVRVVEGGTTDTTISGLTLSESWSYDEVGFVTQSLEGSITTPAGTSAVTAARQLGLSLPSASFGYVTNGPGGCDVQQLDEGDTKATFTSTIRQVGAPLPAGVGPSFSVNVETTVSNGWKVTTTTVSAQGTGAAAAVAAQLPAGAETSRQSLDKFSRSASGTFVKREPASGASLLRSHTISASGGDRPTRYSQRSGGRAPLEHIGTFQVIEIEEAITVEAIGAKASTAFQYPPSLNGVQGIREDRSRFRISAPYVSQLGRDASSHTWAVDVRRAYFAKDWKAAYAAIAFSTIAARQGAGNFTDATTETGTRLSGKET